MQKICAKQQWMTYARPDISYATKELARSLTQPTTLCQKLKHLLRYIKGTQHYRFYVRPIVRTIGATPDLNVFVHSDWAGRATTRKSTPGSVIKFMGLTIHFGTRAQATIALSSAEAVRYATSGTSYRKRSTSRRPTSGSTQTLRAGKACSQELEPQRKQSTSSSNTFSSPKHLFIQQLAQHAPARTTKITTVRPTTPRASSREYVAT